MNGWPEDEPHASGGRLLGLQRAAVPVRDMAGDRQAEAGPSPIAAAGRVHPGDSPENPLPLGFGNSGAVVADRQLSESPMSASPRPPRSASRTRRNGRVEIGHVPLGVVEEAGRAGRRSSVMGAG